MLAILFALLALLCPIGIYCFFLASINQRSRPLRVNGRWDAVGLLFALSGFALITVPTLAGEIADRYAVAIISLFVFDPAWVLWATYYPLVVCAGWLLTIVRAPTTEIYHVDAAMFGKVLEGTLATRGLVAIRERDRLILTKANDSDSTGITPSAVPMAPAPVRERLGTLHVEVFPAMCHITLRWDHCRADLRREIETELEKSLVLAVPDENPAAGWFLSVAGLVFGALAMVIFTFAFLILFGKR